MKLSQILLTVRIEEIMTDYSFQWLQDEIYAKSRTILDLSTWKKFDQEPDVPQQENGFDCGMFVISYSDAIASRGFTFANNVSQADMSEKRYEVV